MNQKEYELLASVIRESRTLEDRQRYWFAAELADTLEGTYPNFDYDKFIVKVGVTPN